MPWTHHHDRTSDLIDGRPEGITQPFCGPVHRLVLVDGKQVHPHHNIIVVFNAVVIRKTPLDRLDSVPEMALMRVRNEDVGLFSVGWMVIGF